MKDASDDDDSLFGEGDLSENDSLGLYDDKSQIDEETNRKPVTVARRTSKSNRVKNSMFVFLS